MADNKDQTRQGKQDLQDLQDRRDKQASQAGSGRHTGGGGAGTSRQSGFVHSSPEANVFPAGSRQGDNSDRSSGGASAAGTPDEAHLGGTNGTSAPGTTGNDPDR